MKVLAAQINSTVGDIEGNAEKIIGAISRARKKKADIVLFPDFALSGGLPEDLLLDASFIEALTAKTLEIASQTRGLMAVIGVPSKNKEGLYHSAAILIDGKLIGFHHKQMLVSDDVFDETRYFQPGQAPSIFAYQDQQIAVMIGEDLWPQANSPVWKLQKERVDLVLHLSADPYSFHQKKARKEALASAAKALQAPLISCQAVGANDQLVFDGTSFHFNEEGALIQIAKGFQEDDLFVDLDARSVPIEMKEDDISDLYQALVLGVRDYFAKQGFKKAVIGLSGGIDSALTACLAKEALGAKNLTALSLPSRFSSSKSWTDAEILAGHLKIPIQKISIEPMFEAAIQSLKPLFGKKSRDVTEENIQARIRGLMLMAYSNKYGALLLNTGSKSEMAMGYMTLYGDLCGGLAVLSDVMKTRVYELARYVNRTKEIIPRSILQKVPSPELKANQTYLDTLPPYEVLDPVIEDYIEERRSAEEIAKKRHLALPFVQNIIARIHRAEFKRRQAPTGIRVTAKSFSKGRSVPIVHSWHD